MLEDHDELHAIVAELRALLNAARMPMCHRFATLRWRLTRCLLRHIAIEARVRPDIDSSRFEQAYRAHIAGWTRDRIDCQWTAYRRETATLLDTLERSMAQEERMMAQVRAIRPAAR